MGEKVAAANVRGQFINLTSAATLSTPATDDPALERNDDAESGEKGTLLASLENLSALLVWFCPSYVP